MRLLAMPHKICSVIPAKAGIHFAYPLPQARILNVPTREINFQRDLKNHLPIIFYSAIGPIQESIYLKLLDKSNPFRNQKQKNTQRL